MKKILPVAVWLCLVIYLPCSAGTITGKILGQDQQPIEFATVTLVKPEDSSLVKGEFTDANGFFSLEKIPNGRFDLIITDILMPDMEGIEFIMKLRAKSPRVPIIAISGGGRVSNASFLTFAQKLGANAVLEKPFGRDQLLDVVTRVLATS